MIQLVKQSVNDSSLQDIYMRYINLSSNGDPLIGFTSHQTGDSTTCISPNWSETDRYSKAGIWIIMIDPGDHFRRLGYINIGSKNLPMGFYNITVYDNNDSSTNLDPTGLTVLWRGLGNLTALQTGATKFPAVEYTDYDTNDAATESVYVTID